MPAEPSPKEAPPEGLSDSSASSEGAPDSSAEQPTRSTSLSPLRIALGLALTLVLFILLVRFVGGARNLRGALVDLRALPLLLSVATSLLAVGTTALRMRWALLIRKDDVPWARCLRAVLSAWPISILTPSRAGDFYRAAHLGSGVPLTRGLGAVLVEKIVDALALFAIAGWGAGTTGHPLLRLACWGAVGAGLLALLRPGWLDWIQRIPLPHRAKLTLSEVTQATRELHGHPMILLRLTLASLFVVSVACLHLWLLLRATHSPVSLEEVIRYWPLAMVAGALPLTPAGMATRDAAFLFLLESDRGSPEVLLATFFYGLTAWVYAFVGVPLLLRSSVLHPKITDTMTNDETRGRQRKAGKGREAGSR